MNALLTLAAKDLRLLVRDPRAAVILLLMPVILILILGLSLGEAFGRKQDDRIRISVVVLDEGLPPEKTPLPDAKKSKAWSDVVISDLTDTADIHVDFIDPNSRATAEKLVKRGERAAVVIFEPEFSNRIHRCSFVGEPFQKEPINPLYQGGMRTRELGVTILRNPTQMVSASVIEQVVQVTLLRVVIPWMIGNAFELIGTDEFMNRMEKHIPALRLAYTVISKKTLGEGIQKGIEAFFSSYKFTAKTWAALTKSEAMPAKDSNRSIYESQDNGNFNLNRGAIKYQVLVPSYTVTFAFFLVLTVGWLFVAERKNGTMVRLRAAPLSRWQILLGKLIPCLIISLIQGFFLLICGKIVFGMNWGPYPILLVPVVISTSLAAVGLSMLVAGMARTETQVAVYGTLLVLILAGVSGSMMPRDMMPEAMRKVSLFTPHTWALDAYSQLLANPEPQVGVVLTACGMLALFGLAFTLLAWLLMKLD